MQNKAVYIESKEKIETKKGDHFVINIFEAFQ